MSGSYPNFQGIAGIHAAIDCHSPIELKLNMEYNITHLTVDKITNVLQCHNIHVPLSMEGSVLRRVFVDHILNGECFQSSNFVGGTVYTFRNVL